MPRRRSLLTLPLAPLAAPRLAWAEEEEFPARSLRLVLPFAPGGAVDLTGRLLAELLAPVLGQGVVVENRGGAAGNLGGDAVARAEKDGYSLLLGSATLLNANPFLFPRSMPFDPLVDLAPISRVATGTLVLVVNAGRPWQSFAELVAAAKEKPGRIVMGSSGTGSASHLMLAALNHAAGIEIDHLPYRGGAAAIQDLRSGAVDMMFDVIPALIPQIRAGRFRPLAVASAGRVGFVPELREVPGMAELLPRSGIDMHTWYAALTTGGTSEERVAVLHRAVRQVVLSDPFRARLEPLGFTPVADASPGDCLDYLRAQQPVWKELVDLAGARLG